MTLKGSSGDVCQMYTSLRNLVINALLNQRMMEVLTQSKPAMTNPSQRGDLSASTFSRVVNGMCNKSEQLKQTLKILQKTKSMISDYVMTNINHHFRNKTAITIKPTPPLPSLTHHPSRPTLTPELIKQNLPSLIRRNNQPSITINETRPKSPSPISKSRLKMVLESSKQENLRSVVKRSPARGGQMTCKTSVSDLFDGKGFQGKSVISEQEEEKEKENLLEVYRQKRKAELQKEIPEKSSKKIYCRRA